MSLNTPAGRYYEPSGRFSLNGILFGLGLGAIAAATLGVLYGHLVQYNPLVYLNVLASFGYGFAIGGAVWTGAKLGKIRSPMLAGFLGFITGCIGLYASWVAWIHALMSQAGAASAWILDPKELWQSIVVVNAIGAWTFKSFTPTHGWLWLVWAAEGMLLVGIPTFWARKKALETPYCESCNSWASTDLSHVRLAPFADSQGLRRTLEAGNFQVLRAQGKASTNSRATELELHACSQCKNVGFLTVRDITQRFNTNGQPSERKVEVVRNLVVDAQGVAVIRQTTDSIMPDTETKMRLSDLVSVPAEEPTLG